MRDKNYSSVTEADRVPEFLYLVEHQEKLLRAEYQLATSHAIHRFYITLKDDQAK